MFYQDGIGCEKNFEKAFYYFNEALKDNNRSAYNNLAYLYLNGLGTEKDYEKSLEYFTKINFRDNYILDILDKIAKGSKIIEIEKLLELRDYSLNDDDIVIINKKNNINYHDYYDYKTLKKIVNKIEEFIKKINLNQSEKNIYADIYNKLANLLKYDHDAYDYKNCYEYALENATTTRNLVGFLKEVCVCNGHAEILKNILDFVNIKAEKLSSFDHSFNKIMIDKCWYYCDLTKDILNIEKGQNIENYLVSKEEFLKDPSHIAFEDNE